MRRIAIINQKGGVGKTTTAVNLSAALALGGQKVCVLDLDPQAHATAHFGLAADGQTPSMYDVLVESKTLAEVRRPVGQGLWLCPSDINLAAAEVELAGVVGREVILRDALEQDNESFDYIVMDCGPSLGVLTLNALAAASEVFIPLQPHFLALHGLGKLLETCNLVARRVNPSLRVTGIVICMFDASTRLANEVISDLEAYLEKSRTQPVPWASASIFRTRIRRNIKLAECPGHGVTIFQYEPKSHGAEDYWALCQEVLQQAKASSQTACSCPTARAA